MTLSRTSKRMILVIGISSLVIIACGAVFYRSTAMFPFALGTLLGSALNALKLLLLERVVDKSITMEQKTAANYIRLQYILRLFMTGALLAAAALLPFINLWGAAAGVFTLQIAAFVAKHFHDDDPVKGDTADASDKAIEAN